MYWSATNVNCVLIFLQFVFASFWSLYTYDRELVYPKVLDEIIPTWLNHAMVRR